MSEEAMKAMQGQIQQLAHLLSAESGSNYANTAVLMGIVAATKKHPEVAQSIEHFLEELYVPMLSEQRNSVHLRAFEERAELFRALLSSSSVKS